MNDRYYLAKLNIVTTLFSKIVVIVCGFIVPRIMIGAFGSETYGATVSISNFLAYITLLEGGIGGVARSALYKPLYDKNLLKVSLILNELNRFFNWIALFFVAYTIGVAYSFYYVSNITALNQGETFWLVVVISISTIIQYFIGVKYTILLQADQRSYVVNVIYMVTTVLNVVVLVILLLFESNLIMVKLFSSIVYVLRPVFVYMYVKKEYNLVQCVERSPLEQKWTGMGQHFAFFMHSNTSVMVLTIFNNLSSVAVYSVYNMVVSQIENITKSFTSGIEALFGNIIAEQNFNELKRIFGYYELLIHSVSTILFSCTIVLIVQFISLYTKGIVDTEYNVPLFAMVLSITAMLYCFRLPYHSVIVAIGHFSETKVAAYGEVLINVFISTILVFEYGLNGVAIGAMLATAFRFLYYVFYLRDKILNINLLYFAKRITLNFVDVLVIYYISKYYIINKIIDSYFEWFKCGFFVFLLSIFVTLFINIVFYKREMIFLINKIFKRL